MTEETKPACNDVQLGAMLKAEAAYAQTAAGGAALVAFIFGGGREGAKTAFYVTQFVAPNTPFVNGIANKNARGTTEALKHLDACLGELSPDIPIPLVRDGTLSRSR